MQFAFNQFYTGEELTNAPVGMIVKDEDGDYIHKSEAGWEGRGWLPDVDSALSFTVVTIPPYGEVKKGGVYPESMLYDLPDGTVLSHSECNMPFAVKIDGEWWGEVKPSTGGQDPFRVTHLPEGWTPPVEPVAEWIIGETYTGESLNASDVPEGAVFKSEALNRAYPHLQGKNYPGRYTYTLMNLPPYDRVEVGKYYPIEVVRGLPDGALVKYGSDENIKHNGRWIGSDDVILNDLDLDFVSSNCAFVVAELPEVQTVAEWVIGETYTGEELASMPAGAVVKDTDGDLGCKAFSESNEWVGACYSPQGNPRREYTLLNLPSYDVIEVGKYYPAHALAGLPDGSILKDKDCYGEDREAVKLYGRWFGEHAHRISGRYSDPLCVDYLPPTAVHA